MIYWDLDGVLRNLQTMVFGCYPQHWDEKISGHKLCWHVNRNLSWLEEAPTTEYFPVALQYQPIVIITSQPENWRAYTMRWIERRIRAVVKFVNKPDEKLKELRNGDYLIDDCPNFSSFERIILVDRPYNQHVKAKYRVKTPGELEVFLNW